MSNPYISVAFYHTHKRVALFRYVALLFACSMLILVGCSEPPRAAEPTKIESDYGNRGGGFALFYNGELVGIGPDGSIGGSCNVCGVDESRDDCESRAKRLEIPLCEDIVQIPDQEYQKQQQFKSDGHESSKRPQTQIDVIRSARAQGQSEKECTIITAKGPQSVARYSKCADIPDPVFGDVRCYCW